MYALAAKYHVLLWLAAARICNQQCAVILQQSLLDLDLALLVDILLVVGNDSLANGLAQSCMHKGYNTDRVERDSVAKYEAS